MREAPDISGPCPRHHQGHQKGEGGGSAEGWRSRGGGGPGGEEGGRGGTGEGETGGRGEQCLQASYYSVGAAWAKTARKKKMAMAGAAVVRGGTAQNCAPKSSAKRAPESNPKRHPKFVGRPSYCKKQCIVSAGPLPELRNPVAELLDDALGVQRFGRQLGGTSKNSWLRIWRGGEKIGLPPAENWDAFWAAAPRKLGCHLGRPSVVRRAGAPATPVDTRGPIWTQGLRHRSSGPNRPKASLTCRHFEYDKREQ